MIEGIKVTNMDNPYLTYGVYDFNNFTRVDPFAGDEDVNYTIIHESVHLILSQSTFFGITNYIVDQLSWQSKERIIQLNKISERLVKASIKVHEATAVFYEYLVLKDREGDTIYKEKIKKLEQDNNEYFKYVEPIKFLLDDCNVDDIKETNIVFRMALLSLNGDITNLPNNYLKKPGKLWNYFTHPVEGVKYNPNKRFSILVIALKKLLNKYKLNEITDELLINESELKNTFISEDWETPLLSLKKWLYKELYTDNTKFVLKELLDQIVSAKILEEENQDELIEKYWAATHPTPLNNRYKNIKTDFSEVNFKNICAVYLVALEQSKIMLIAIDVSEGINYLDIMSNEEAAKFLSNCKKKIIISHEHYQLLKNDSELNVFLSKNFFVYVDIPYIRSEKFINDNISSGKEIMLTKFGENLYHLIIKMKDENGVIIIPLFEQSLRKIGMEIKSKKYIPVNDYKESVFIRGNLCTFCYEDIICAISLKEYWGEERVTFLNIR